MDGNRKIIFGVRHGGIRIYDPTASDNDSYSSARAVVSVVEMLGDEALIYASLDLDDPDSQSGAIILKADPDVTISRGDVIDISITQRKFHVFDAESGHSIKRRIPEENAIPCDIKEGKLCFEGQKLPLPPALLRPDTDGAEAIMPLCALTLGHGDGTAEVVRTERVAEGTLYALGVGDIRLFAFEEGDPQYAVGAKVSYGIDPCLLTVQKCGIIPPHLANSLDGTLTKEKKRSGGYEFFFAVGGARLTPSPQTLEKLFMCKGTGIFRTPLELAFDADAVSVQKVSEENIDNSRLFGTVTTVSDYGYVRYAEIALSNGRIIAPYDGEIADRVALALDMDKITVKDKKVDMIIA